MFILAYFYFILCDYYFCDSAKSLKKSKKSDKKKGNSYNDDNSSHGSTQSERSRYNGISRGVKITNLPLRSSGESLFI